MRASTKGLTPGTRIHIKGDRLNSPEDGYVVEVEERKVEGTVVWFKGDSMPFTKRPARLERISIVRGPRATAATPAQLKAITKARAARKRTTATNNP